MKNIPKISIIIPVHNAEPYLKPCLDCIVRQTLRDFECICVNDASTDESRATIESLMKEDKRFSVVDIPASGAGAARNRGMELAKGKYLLFLDADDLFEPTLLEKLYNRAEETGADIVFCKHQIYETQKDLTIFRKKSAIGTEKSAIGTEKSAIDAQKSAIGERLSSLSLSAPSREKVQQLFSMFGLERHFGRKDVSAIAHVQYSNAGTLIASLRKLGVIVPVSGSGKGKYRFNPQLPTLNI